MVFAVTIFGYSKGSGQRDSFPSGKWVDLSHDYSEETPYWPTADGFKLTVDFNRFGFNSPKLASFLIHKV